MIPYVSARFTSLAEEADALNVTAADYTVMVWGIGPDEELRAHFDKYDGTVCPPTGFGLGRVAPMPQPDEPAPGVLGPPGDVPAPGVLGPPGEVAAGVADVYIGRRDGEILQNFLLRKNLLTTQYALDQAVKHQATRTPEDPKRVKAEKRAAANEALAPPFSRGAKIQTLDVSMAQNAGQKSPAVCGFITFNSQGGKNDCLRHYTSKGTWHIPLFRPQAKQFQLNGSTPLSVSKADEPSNILWENLECSWLNRSARRLFSVCVSFVIIVIALAVIVGGKIYVEELKANEALCANATFVGSCNMALEWRRNMPGYNSTVAGVPMLEVANSPLYYHPTDKTTTLYNAHPCRYTDNFNTSSKTPYGPPSFNSSSNTPYGPPVSTECTANSTISEQQWQALTQAGFNASAVLSNHTPAQCTACLCGALMAQDPTLWSRSWDIQGVRGEVRDPVTDQAACTTQAGSLFAFYGLQMVAIFIVVIFNSIMQITTAALAETSAAMAVFIGQFLNTGLIALIVYANVSFIADAISDGSNGELSSFPFFAGPFKDFNERWYAIVGVQIITTVLVNVVELNEMFAGTEFTLATRYGMLLNALFVCFMYSSGIPVLLLFGAGIFHITYYLDKSPPLYPERLAMYVLSTFKYAAVLHLLMGCWVFSASRDSGGYMFPRPAISPPVS
ncbi:hypothetical protein T484DRAFT_1855267 [Baffinella frigidus]|nr:hypothetical protein T484DRAFT_1855267 [Cryptophyta sp. CCMP2293]